MFRKGYNNIHVVKSPTNIGICYNSFDPASFILIKLKKDLMDIPF
jgi:hypothetical protein